MRLFTKSTRWPAYVLIGVTLAWTVAMAASLRWHFLNSLAAGTYNNRIALDFFQTPAGFLNLTAGNNIFLTELCNYSDYGSAYHTHPLLAVAVGPWTAPFSPWTAYGLFVAASLLMLAAAGGMLASAFERPTERAFAFFAMFCSVPTYLMLWAGQMHVFVVLAVAMILAGLMRLAEQPENADRYLRWIQAGVLISLFTKPVALVMLPVLLLMPETRRKLFSPIAIYAAVSLAFLLVPRLNPGGYNAKHWLNLFHASASASQVLFTAAPQELNFGASHVIFSLPRLLYGHCPRSAASAIVAVTLAAIILMSFAPLFAANRIERIRAAIVALGLCVLSHYLCFFLAFEDHYTSMLPLLPALWWLRCGENNRRRRWLITAAFAAACCVLIPTPNILHASDPTAMWLPNALMRVVPAVVAFVLLAIYGAAFVKANAEGGLQAAFAGVGRQIMAAVPMGMAVGVCLAIVVLAAVWTAPARLLVTPSQWTPADRIAHFEDMLSRPGARREAQFYFHRMLAITYAPTDESLALRHYTEANRLTTHNAVLTVEVAGAFQACHHTATAKKLLATLSPEQIKEPNARKRYFELRRQLEMNGSVGK